MQKANSYIVIISPGLSGAEKRFFDVFCGLLSKGKKVHFVVPSMLADILRAEYGDRDVFDSVIEIKMQRWSRLGFVLGFHKLLKSLERGSLFHYPMNALPFLHLLRGDQVTMSICDCEVVPTPWRFYSKRSFYTYLVARFSRKVDILSPQIFRGASLHGSLKNKVQLTPGGTYIGGFSRGSIEKSPVVAFIGRLQTNKGIMEFLRIFPEIWSRIKTEVPPGFKVCIAGKGVLYETINQMTTDMRQEGMPIFCQGYVKVPEFIRPVSVVVSLQQNTNYPSRVVAEALLSGASVIVRDTGDSRMFGTSLPGLYYCGAELDAIELSSLILSTLKRYASDDGFALNVSRESEQVFCSQKYIDYFDALISR